MKVGDKVRFISTMPTSREIMKSAGLGQVLRVAANIEPHNIYHVSWEDGRQGWWSGINLRYVSPLTRLAECAE